MACARQRTFKAGVCWTGVYLDPDGRKRAAGSFRQQIPVPYDESQSAIL